MGHRALISDIKKEQSVSKKKRILVKVIVVGAILVGAICWLKFGFFNKLNYDRVLFDKYKNSASSISGKPVKYTSICMQLKSDGFIIAELTPPEKEMRVFYASKNGTIILTRGINVRFWVDKAGIVDKMVVEYQISVF